MALPMVLYAKDIVEKEVLALPSGTSVLEAARLMRESHHGFVIVMTADGKPAGIATEWDFLTRVIAEDRDPEAVRLEEIMSRNLVSVDGSAALDAVAQMMVDRGTRRVLVVKDGTILGVIDAKTILVRMKAYIDRLSAQIARAQTPMF
jgi:CBS domain-containing protein